MRLIAPDALPSKGVTFERSWLYRLIRAGKFPKPIKLGERRIAFLEDEVDAWLAARVAERDQAAPPANEG